MRNCGSCGESLSMDSYSGAQWAKGIGASRCNGCVANGDGLDAAAEVPTARDNNATRWTVPGSELDHPFASGTFRWVAKAKYTAGDRAGETCVIKWFKTGGVMEERFYAADLKVVDKAVELVRGWNAARIVGSPIRVNRPQVSTFLPGPRVGQKVLTEPFIHGYRRFNSNSGWTSGASATDGWAAAMQALSHWTYHSTGGQLTLADLQGGVSVSGAVITDPVILSTTAGSYGVTDLGPDGVTTFFARHTCGRYCRAEWTRPRGVPAGGKLLPLVQSTTMHGA